MPYVGLSIDNEYITYINLEKKGSGYRLNSFASEKIEANIFENGEVVDEVRFINCVSKFVKKHKIFRAKVSIPEEKVYLFTTTVPSIHDKTVYQNIESKLEENLPLKASDCIFSFDYVGHMIEQAEDLVSVTVTQSVYIERYLDLLKKAGVRVVSFDSLPHAVVKALCTDDSNVRIVAHIKESSLGTYVALGNKLLFSSTVSLNTLDIVRQGNRTDFVKYQIGKVISYWQEQTYFNAKIESVLLLHENENDESIGIADVDSIKAYEANVWVNVFDIKKSLPQINKSDAHLYVTSIGLSI
jgi:Tfp pilus assembly PilM family ATPase